MYDTYEDALKAAYDEFGLQPFFVRRIEAVPQIGYFSRDVAACQPT